MRNVVVITLLLITSKMTVNAQTTSLGPTVGINGWENSDHSVKVGINFGASFIYSKDPQWGFGADLKFSMQGGGKTIGNYTANSTLNYIKIPLKAIYFFGSSSQRFRPKFFVGPSFGFLVGGKINGSYSGMTIPQQNSLDYTKHFDLGILFGTGINYRLKPGTWLNVDLGYTSGLLNIVKPNTQTSSFTPSEYNQSVALNVGISFPIGATKNINTKSGK